MRRSSTVHFALLYLQYFLLSFSKAFNSTDVVCKVDLVIYDVRGQMQDHEYHLCETLVEDTIDSIGTYALDVDPASHLAQFISTLSATNHVYIAFPPDRISDPDGTGLIPTLVVRPGDTVEIVPPKDIETLFPAQRNRRVGVRGSLSQTSTGEDRKLSLVSVGARKAAIVRVRAQDRVPEICQIVVSFGDPLQCTSYNNSTEVKTDGDASKSSYTFMYQYTFLQVSPYLQYCSNGEFSMNVTNIIPVTLDRNISQYNYVSIYFEAKRKVNQMFGFPLGADPAVELGVDFILYHVPRGMSSDTDADFSVGAIGGTFSIFQDKSFLPSIIMHELGHNMGLNHARENLLNSFDGDTTEDVEYGDDSGLMGTSLDGTTVVHFPNMLNVYVDGRCYNAYNYYSLRWYSNLTREVKLQNSTTGDYKYIRMTNDDTFLNANKTIGFYKIIRVNDFFIMVGENRIATEYTGKLVVLQAERNALSRFTGRTDVRAILSYPGINLSSKVVYGDTVIEICDGRTLPSSYGLIRYDDYGIVIGKGVGCEKVPDRCDYNTSATVLLNKMSTAVPCYSITSNDCKARDWNYKTAKYVWETCQGQCRVMSGCPALSVL